MQQQDADSHVSVCVLEGNGQIDVCTTNPPRGMHKSKVLLGSQKAAVNCAARNRCLVRGCTQAHVGQRAAGDQQHCPSAAERLLGQERPASRPWQGGRWLARPTFRHIDVRNSVLSLVLHVVSMDDTAERLGYLSSFVSAFSDLVEVRSSSEKGFGLHTSKACSQGCVLLRVPFSSCITREDADIEDTDPQALLRFSTLRTLRQPEDPRAIYLCRAAPLASFTSHPATWPASLASVCGMAARRLVN
eukprot:s148_g11.t2